MSLDVGTRRAGLTFRKVPSSANLCSTCLRSVFDAFHFVHFMFRVKIGNGLGSFGCKI